MIHEDLLKKIYSDEEIQAMRGLFPVARDIALKLQGKVPDAILNFESFPFGMDTRAHLQHLLHIEEKFSQRPLRILDLNCSGGDFSRLARSRGHEVLSSEGEIISEHITASDLHNMGMFRNYFQRKQREINKVDVEPLYVNSEELDRLVLPENLDLIYVCQSGVHAPAEDGGKFWQELEWRAFFVACSMALNSEGMVFMTLSDPSYMHLGKYLQPFFKNYLRVFPEESRYWTHLVVDATNRSFIFSPLPEKTDPRDKERYEVVGEPATVWVGP